MCTKNDLDCELLAKINNTHFPGNSYREKHLKYALATNDDLERIYHLTESHSPGFRLKATHLYERMQENVQNGGNVPTMCKHHFSFKCPVRGYNKEMAELLDKVNEMPPEWTLVQLTNDLTCKQELELNSNTKHLSALNLTVFNCGQRLEQPIHVSLETPCDVLGNEINVLRSIEEVIAKDEERYQRVGKATNAERVKLLKEVEAIKRDLNAQLKNIISTIENYWLRAWSLLFLGKLVDKEVEEYIDIKLKEIVKTLNLELDGKSKILLKYLIRGYKLLTTAQLKHAYRKYFKALTPSAIAALNEALKMVQMEKPNLHTEKTHPVILIVEERLDILPWEMLPTLKHQPISRMQSFHFTYALFKEFEADIVGGWKLIKTPLRAGHILNPGRDLMRMQQRLGAFFTYVFPEWKAVVGERPTSAQILDILEHVDVFCYNGHGDGFQFVDGHDIQKLRIDAVVLLFGCSSVRLKDLGPGCEFFGSHQKYITACSPCVVGMLWPVSDSEVDLISTKFLNQWIKADSGRNWDDVNLNGWANCDKSFKIRKNAKEAVRMYEPELLRALNNAKLNARQTLTQAACIARGIPVKLSY